MVGVKGMPRPVVSCAQPVAEGMEVTTTGKDVEEARKSVMEFLLINHPLDCPECDQSGECKLQDYSYDSAAITVASTRKRSASPRPPWAPR